MGTLTPIVLVKMNLSKIFLLVACVLVMGLPEEGDAQEDRRGRPRRCDRRGGWRAYRSKCYKLFTDRKTWFRAVGLCKRLGGDLPSIPDSGVNDFLYNWAKQKLGKNYKYFLVGGYEGVENSWGWIDNTNWQFTNWGVGEPNNFENSEDCLSVENQGFGGKWTDHSCNRRPAPYFCAK